MSEEKRRGLEERERERERQGTVVFRQLPLDIE